MSLDGALCPECKKGHWVCLGIIPNSIPLHYLYRCSFCDAGTTVRVETFDEDYTPISVLREEM